MTQGIELSDSGGIYEQRDLVRGARQPSVG
jgi:hypothetical protein